MSNFLLNRSEFPFLYWDSFVDEVLSDVLSRLSPEIITKTSPSNDLSKNRLAIELTRGVVRKKGWSAFNYIRIGNFVFSNWLQFLGPSTGLPFVILGSLWGANAYAKIKLEKYEKIIDTIRDSLEDYRADFNEIIKGDDSKGNKEVRIKSLHHLSVHAVIEKLIELNQNS